MIRVILSLGYFIEWSMNHAGLTQAMFARKAGFSSKMVNQVVKDHVPPSRDFLEKFEEITGMPAIVIRQLEEQVRGAQRQRDEMGVETVDFRSLLNKHVGPKRPTQSRPDADDSF